MKVHAFHDNTTREMSPAFRFVNTFYCCSAEKVRHSGQSKGVLMRQVVNLAIEGGLRFDEDDFSRRYSDRYGAGTPMLYGAFKGNGGYGEHWHTLAARCGNISACRAFEKLRGRKPFIVDGKRLYCGSNVTIDGEKWIVTSFNDAAGHVVLCHYLKTRNVYYSGQEAGICGEGKPDKIMKLTHKGLKLRLASKREE